MALIKCPECGREISDKAESCPGCGCPGSEFKPSGPEDTRSEFERIVDEIYSEQPGDALKNAKLLRKRTGISRQEASKIMTARRKEWVKAKKRGEFPDTQYCPVCGAQDFYYVQSGSASTGHTKAFGGSYITVSSLEQMMKCNMCGYKWAPKRKKRR